MAESYNICLDIGGTKILGVIFNSKREIVYRLKKKTKAGGDSSQNVEEVIISVVEELISESGIKKSQINAIAAGAPGVINQDTGVVLFSPNLPWRNYDIRKPIEDKFGAKFYIGNDVNVGVLGEYKFGAAKGYKNVVGLFVGTGMGGGLILDGKLFTGNQFKAAEYGMSAYIRQQVSRGRESMMAEAVQGGVFKSKALKKALESGDAVATEAVDRACHYLAIATGNLVNTFSPDIVVYGGGVIEAVGDTFLEKITAEVDRYCMPSIRETVEFKKAALGDDSILYGALSMIKK